MSDLCIPEGTQFYSDYFKSITGQEYFLRQRDDEKYEYWAFTRWVIVSGSDEFILNHLKPIKEYERFKK